MFNYPLVSILEISKHISSGLTPSRKNPDFWNNGTIPWLKTEQLGEYKITDTTEKITEQALNETRIKLYPKNTISVAMYGEGKTRGNVSILDNEMTTNQACCNIIIDEKKAYFKYVYYALKNNYTNLRMLSSGVRKNLNTNDIKKFEIPLPPLEVQKEIGDFLGDIDEKISINNKINFELNSWMEFIYDYYFLQFEFPDNQGNPYKSSGGEMVWDDNLNRYIPKGWKVKRVSDLVPVLTGKKDANFATIDGKYKFFTCSQESLQCDEYEFEGNAILIAGNGDFNVKTYSGKFNAYQRTYVLIPENSCYYGYLAQLLFRNISSFKSSSQGSIVKFIKKGDIENIPVLIPADLQLLEKFNVVLDMIHSNCKQNEQLLQLRNFLLPMLMNGQINLDSE